MKKAEPKVKASRKSSPADTIRKTLNSATHDERIECKQDELTCGIVMPLSSMADCPKEHWTEVYYIISEAISDAGFAGAMVSDAIETTIIHSTIVKRLYGCDMVVCDVSCKNPNVMFELGMRLAFDKPVVLIKDHETLYTFDVGPIEHIGYPRDLNYHKVLEFKKTLTSKILDTFNASRGKEYTSFLKSFGDMQPATFSASSLTSDQVMLEYMENLSAQVRQIRNNIGDIANRRSSLYSSQSTANAFLGKQSAPYTTYYVDPAENRHDNTLNFLRGFADKVASTDELTKRLYQYLIDFISENGAFYCKSHPELVLKNAPKELQAGLSLDSVTQILNAVVK